jgi:hypothetical protein
MREHGWKAHRVLVVVVIASLVVAGLQVCLASLLPEKAGALVIDYDAAVTSDRVQTEELIVEGNGTLVISGANLQMSPAVDGEPVSITVTDQGRLILEKGASITATETVEIFLYANASLIMEDSDIRVTRMTADCDGPLNLRNADISLSQSSELRFGEIVVDGQSSITGISHLESQGPMTISRSTIVGAGGISPLRLVGMGDVRIVNDSSIYPAEASDGSQVSIEAGGDIEFSDSRIVAQLRSDLNWEELFRNLMPELPGLDEIDWENVLELLIPNYDDKSSVIEILGKGNVVLEDSELASTGSYWGSSVKVEGRGEVSVSESLIVNHCEWHGLLPLESSVSLRGGEVLTFSDGSKIVNTGSQWNGPVRLYGRDELNMVESEIETESSLVLEGLGEIQMSDAEITCAGDITVESEGNIELAASKILGTGDFHLPDAFTLELEDFGAHLTVRSTGGNVTISEGTDVTREGYGSAYLRIEADDSVNVVGSTIVNAGSKDIGDLEELVVDLLGDWLSSYMWYAFEADTVLEAGHHIVISDSSVSNSGPSPSLVLRGGESDLLTSNMENRKGLTTEGDTFLIDSFVNGGSTPLENDIYVQEPAMGEGAPSRTEVYWYADVTVYDVDGVPVPGAQISLLDADSGEPASEGGRGVHELMTDEEGFARPLVLNVSKALTVLLPMSLPKPDLAVSESDLSLTVGPNGYVTVAVTIHNDGTADANDVVVRFYEGEPSEETFIAEAPLSVPMDGSEVVQAEWEFASLENSVYVVVDPDDLIFESDESNNQASRALTDTDEVEEGPDLAISASDITLSPEDPVAGETVTITATIENLGTGNVTDVIVEFWDGDSWIGNATLSLEAGANGTVSVEWEATAGDHDLRVVVDPDNMIAEQDETTNNEATKSITVEPETVAAEDDDDIPLWIWVLIAVGVITLFAVGILLGRHRGKGGEEAEEAEEGTGSEEGPAEESGETPSEESEGVSGDESKQSASEA